MSIDRPPIANASRTPSRTFVTGFLGFGRFADNPSAALARTSGRAFRLIEVSYAAVDAFVAGFDASDVPGSSDGSDASDSLDRSDVSAASSIGRIVLLGVAGSSETFRIERQARNQIGVTPDVRGVVPPGRSIDPSGPAVRLSTLWPVGEIAEPGFNVSDDAGDYLCNYLYWRMLERCPTLAIGFLHVPPIEQLDLETQQRRLGELLAAVEGAIAR